MSNKEFIDLYDQTRENHHKLHSMLIDDLNVWFVDGLGQRENAEIQDCRDFAAITAKGAVIDTDDHGTWLKISDQYWVDVAKGVGSLAHDLDLVMFILREKEHNNHTATIIDPVE